MVFETEQHSCGKSCSPADSSPGWITANEPVSAVGTINLFLEIIFETGVSSSPFLVHIFVNNE